MQLTEMFGDSKSSINQTKAEVTAIAHSIFSNAHVDISVKEAEGELYMTVSLLRIPKDDRKKGIGSSIMKALCDYADKKSIIVALSPTSEFGTGKATLMHFYKSFGFIRNSGRSRNWQVVETLIRYPVVNESLFDKRVKPNFISHINNIIGNKYATLNEMKNVRRINYIKDPKAKSDMISQMAKDLEALFKQII
jgi:uncharacterized protein YaiE (UPF0345 family)